MRKKCVLVKPRGLKQRFRAFFLGEWKTINGKNVRSDNFLVYFALKKACLEQKVVTLDGFLLFDGFFQIEAVLGEEKHG